MEPLNAIDRMVGRRIKARRHELKIDQRAIAVALAVPADAIDRYEDGRVRLSAAQLFSLTRLLEVRVNYFFQTFDEPVGPAEFEVGTPMSR